MLLLPMLVKVLMRGHLRKIQGRKTKELNKIGKRYLDSSF